MAHLLRCLRHALDELYEQYNQRQFVHPDPLEFLYHYQDARDREIVALIASCLAYGRVAQILRSIRIVLDRLGPSPFLFLERTRPRDLPEVFGGFKHRWTTGQEVGHLLAGARQAIVRYGSLGQCFAAGLRPEHDTTLAALVAFVEQLRVTSGPGNGLLPNVSAGGACKRLHLMLRWLVRQDAVDPGGWTGISPRLLIVPLDTHMHQIGTALGLCAFKQASGRAAAAMTAAFRELQPQDPVRYDFALTRLGIRAELDREAFIARCREIQGRRSAPRG